MSILDDAKDKIEDAKDKLEDKVNDLENEFHEKKGELKGRRDQAEEDKARRNDELDDNVKTRTAEEDTEEETEL